MKHTTRTSGYRKTIRSVSRMENGKPVEWVYIVPAENVAAYLRRTSKNPNSQS